MSCGASGAAVADDNVRAFPNRKIQPFRVLYPGQWEGIEPAPIRWVVKNAIPRGTVCLFSGDSGLGKSLLMQQLQVCLAVNRAWLGYEVEPARSFGFYCEDPENILHLRVNALCRHFGVALPDLDDVSMITRLGMDNSIMGFNQRSNVGHVTPVYEQIRAHALDFGAQVIIVDTLAHTFNGNENIRQQVTLFVAALQRIATEIDGAVILTSHPSVTSMQSGTGYSGSTAWRATVRAHMYLKRPKGYDDEDLDADHETRVLKTMKSNWGPGGGSTKIKWDNGVFVAQEQERREVVSTLGRLTIDADALKAMEYIIGHGDKIAAGHNHKNCAETLLMRMPSCRQYKRSDLAAAVDRMIEDGRVVVVTMGPKSRSFSYTRPSHIRYPGEP
jgi:RecA-family ATPase